MRWAEERSASIQADAPSCVGTLYDHFSLSSNDVVLRGAATTVFVQVVLEDGSFT